MNKGWFKKGQHPSVKTEFKKGHIPWNQGRPLPEATKKKLSIANSGFKHSEESKKKMSEAHKGKKVSKETRRKLSDFHKGLHDREKSNNWKGGIKKHQRGYIYILNPNHPFCTKDGYVFKHRLIIETQIGRHLKPEEACHHINKIKNDNRPENLMAFSSHSAHRTYERGKNLVSASDIIFDGRKL